MAGASMEVRVCGARRSQVPGRGPWVAPFTGAFVGLGRPDSRARPGLLLAASNPRLGAGRPRGGEGQATAAAAAATAAAGGQAQEPWNLQLGDGRDPWPARRQHPIHPSMDLARGPGSFMSVRPATGGSRRCGCSGPYIAHRDRSPGPPWRCAWAWARSLAAGTKFIHPFSAPSSSSSSSSPSFSLLLCARTTPRPSPLAGLGAPVCDSRCSIKGPSPAQAHPRPASTRFLGLPWREPRSFSVAPLPRFLLP